MKNRKGNAMTIHRRRFLHLAAGTAALPATSRIAFAETYPTRPVQLVVGFSAGSASDINARIISQWLSNRLAQRAFVDNRSGAGGNIATEYVMRARADGYTLLYASTAIAINATLYKNSIVSHVGRDLAPVASVVRTPLVMEVTPSLPVKTVPELIAYAKANPGKLNFATVGVGSLQHLSGVYFEMLSGIKMVPVHYHGAGPAITDLIAGRVQVMFDIVVSSLSYINSGKLRALAVTTPDEQKVLPGIPTVGKFVPGYEASGWQGICAPGKTPSDIVATLNKSVNAALVDPAVKASLAKLGGQPFAGTPANFAAFIKSETEKWAKVIRKAGVSPA
jgi:tripartite-type tricarboxylate transporter receptor subunit TctC